MAANLQEATFIGDMLNMSKLKTAVLIILSVSLFIIAGCAKQPEASAVSTENIQNPAPSSAPITAVSAPSVAPEPAPSPSPTPEPVKPPDAERIYNDLTSVDITDYIIPNTYEHDEDLHPYEIITGEPELTYDLPVLYEEWFNDAANSLIDLEIRNVKTKLIPPSWQVLSTLVYNYSNDISSLRKALVNACNYEIGVYKEPGGYSVEITATPRNPMDLFYMIPETERISPITNMLSYAYLATIYDNNMKIRDGIEEREIEPFLFPIADPAQYVVGDTWYDGRDSGTRRHTGTDINAPEGTSLLAVRDGVILDAGNADKAGNYVVLLGDDGNQYHYYHMVEPTDLKPGDEVFRGDVVGHVGNTGNSTANHLHFTIITEDGYYLNPYTYLRDAQKRAVEELNGAAENFQSE